MNNSTNYAQKKGPQYISSPCTCARMPLDGGGAHYPNLRSTGE